MIKRTFLIILVSLIMASCTGIESFDTTIVSLGDNYFVVGCSNEVKNKGDEDIGYNCVVQITDKTTFSNESGDQLSVEDFTGVTNIRVILTNPQSIKKSEESRNVEAKEIILIKQ